MTPNPGPRRAPRAREERGAKALSILVRAAAGLLALAVMAGLGPSGCGESAPGAAGQGRPLVNGVLIGVAWPGDADGFVDGVRLAVDEINRAGGLLREPVRILVDHREGGLQHPPGPAAGAAVLDRDIARRIALDLSGPGVAAVVGHRDPALAIPAAAIYQRRGVLYLSPTSSTLSLTAFGFGLVFRQQPDNALLARAIADYFGIRAYRRIVVAQALGDSARELAALSIQLSAERHGIQTAAHRTFPPGASDRQIRALAVALSRIDRPDAVLLVGNRTDSLRLYRELRRRGVTAPVYGDQGLDTAAFWSALAQWRPATGVPAGFFVPTVADLRSGVALRFAQTYTRTYGHAPERLSAVGYDALKLIAQGVILARAGVLGKQATTPLQIADELRYMRGCVGAAGSYRFFDNGNLRDTTMFVKSLADSPDAPAGAGANRRTDSGAPEFAFEQIGDASGLGLPECGDPRQDRGTIADQPAAVERPR